MQAPQFTRLRHFHHNLYLVHHLVTGPSFSLIFDELTQIMRESSSLHMVKLNVGHAILLDFNERLPKKVEALVLALVKKLESLNLMKV